MNNLPEKFEKKMQEILGSEYEDFLKGFSEERFGGVRFNSMKIDKETWERTAPFDLRPVPWIDNGYYYSLAVQPAKHPFYYAGLYYIQEPSAMTPARILPINPGDRVLDICAAPGGKSTELAAKLNGTGILVSNDISNSRAKALLKNLEVFGTKNAIIVSEAPSKLKDRFIGWFDKILIDAPCSGEGMFRKSPAIMKNWEQYGTEYYHKLQLEIIDSVVPMLAPGGMLVYSTCTFDPDEDEGSVDYILNNYPDMHVVKPDVNYEKFGYGDPALIGSDRDEIKDTIRLWPHKLEGEGHFCALFRKDGETDKCTASLGKAPKLPEDCEKFLNRIGFPIDRNRLSIKDDRIYLLPEGTPDLKGLRIMRMGLLLGEIKKDRFEPSQALACALKSSEFDNVYSIPADDEDVIRYLKCETIEAKTDVKNGYVLVCADGYPLGWAKAQNNVLKNKYLPGWRMM